MIKAFIGHSFEEDDTTTIEAFKKMFNSFKKSMAFDWDDAGGRQIKPLSEKVKQKMAEKNLFIGIFTKKHIEIEAKRLILSKYWHKDKYIARKIDCAYGTSYWIFQESGYAVAKGMSTLFLVEKGVRDLKGLHADAEHIYFERGKESECFSELNEALGMFLKGLKGEGEGSKTEKPPTEPAQEINKIVSEPIKAEEQTTAKVKVVAGKQQEPEQDQEKDDKYYFREIFLALMDGNETRVTELKEEVFKKYKGDEDETIEWQAQILYLESTLIQKSVFEDLKALQVKRPKSSLIAYAMASEYEKYKDYENASKEYLKSAEYAVDKPTRLLRISSASIAYAKRNQKGEAFNILLSELQKDLIDKERYLVYKYLSETAKIFEDDDLFSAFSEKALLLNPSDDSLRFNLAYRYSQLDKNELALYHYKILVSNKPEPANLNNLGVSYSDLGMPNKAIEFYKKASKVGSTISRANLAQKYLNEGFVEEASEQLTKAMETKEYEKDDIGRALTRIDTTKENEKKKEEKILKDVEEVRQFKLEYADAYSIPFVVDGALSGNWICRHGNVNINLESGNILSGETKEETPDFHIGDNFVAGPIYYTVKIISFRGTIVRNRIIQYTIKVEIQPARETLLTPKTYSEYSGYGVINNSMNRIKVLELDRDKKQSIYQFEKK